jgi:hypothetical protein
MQPVKKIRGCQGPREKKGGMSRWREHKAFWGQRDYSVLSCNSGACRSTHSSTPHKMDTHKEMKIQTLANSILTLAHQ